MTQSKSAYQRFIDSMRIDYEKWHDGVGYDLEALPALSPEERRNLVAILRGRGDWRDAEALQRLAELGEASAGEVVQEIIDDPGGPIEQRLMAMEDLRAAGAMSDEELERRLLPALKVAAPYGGITPALRLVQQVPTERIKRRLLWGVLHHPQAGVHYAAMLAFICGKAESDFDWNLRPLFLRTRSNDPAERKQAVAELCQLIGMNPSDAE